MSDETNFLDTPKERVDPEDYHPDYIESCFLFWYESGRKSLRKIAPLVPISSNGKRITEYALRYWYKKGNWKDRADRMDHEVAHEIEKVAIQEKIVMLKRHAEAGSKLVQLGQSFFDEHKIDKPSA